MKNLYLLITICLFSVIFVSCGESKSTEEKPGSQQNSSLIWSVKSLNKMNWQEANDYCQNLTEREQRDWHLPTIEEIRGLIQSCQGTIPGGSCAVSETCADSGCLDENCQACSPESDGSYSRLGDTNQLWSATSVSNYDPAAWYVDFSNAGIYQDEKESYRYARCTRIAKGSERKRDCQELPDKAVWNTVSEITQTWNGEEWIPATTASYNEEASSAECRFKCAENYEWDGSVCVNAKRSAECTGLPENAEWNTVSSITQTWNDEEWVPATTASYNEEGSDTECRFKCNTNYSWKNSRCAADTRTADCTGLPANAVWNNASSITQTWNGSEWIPATSGNYDTNPSIAECRFKCGQNYEWEGYACVNAKRNAECTGLPENAEWNTVSTITQTWNDEDWVPATTAGYNEEASDTECRFKCSTNYSWKNSRCAADTKTANCTGLPANAVWNSASSITQTWNGSDWVPATAGTYNTNPSSAECRFKCGQNYEWSSSTSKCVAAKRQAECSSKPANSVWNDGGASGTFTQTWNGSSWIPESYDSTYSMTAGTCVYNCDSSHFWDNSGCTSPCDYAPCKEIANSTKVCTATSDWQDYECGCKYGYFWDGDGCRKQISIGNICTNQETCYDSYDPLPECPASSSENYFGQDAYYAALGVCTPQDFTIKTLQNQKIIFDNNTRLQWQQSAPTTKYTWEEAKNYCSNLTYAGYSDWRLPDPKDFLTIIDHSRYAPAVDTDYFTNMSSTSSSVYYWTSKSYETYDVHLLFNLYYGLIKTNELLDSSLNVICVRGNELAKGSFTTSTIAGDIVVTDSTSGLMWQKTLEAYYTWVRALKYCENLEYAGYSDWRLPNKNELASLLDYDKPGTHFSDFPDMEGRGFWSSTTDATYSSFARIMDFYDLIGEVDDNASKSYGQYVRCVRSE